MNFVRRTLVSQFSESAGNEPARNAQAGGNGGGRSSNASFPGVLYAQANGGAAGDAGAGAGGQRAGGQANQPAQAQTAANAPRGVRNNNPGNLRPLGRGDQWQGQTGVDRSNNNPAGFSVFDTPENGLCALGINTISQQVLHGGNTVRQILNRHADEGAGDPVDAYTRFVSQHMGVDPDARIETRDPATLRRMMEGIILFENNRQNPYTNEQITNAVDTAVTHHNNRQRQ